MPEEERGRDTVCVCVCVGGWVCMYDKQGHVMRDARCLSWQSSMRSSTRTLARHQTRQVSLCHLPPPLSDSLSLIQAPSLPSPPPSLSLSLSLSHAHTHTHTHTRSLTHVYRHLLSASWAGARQDTGTRGRLRRYKFSKVLPYWVQQHKC